MSQAINQLNKELKALEKEIDSLQEKNRKKLEECSKLQKEVSNKIHLRDSIQIKIAQIKNKDVELKVSDHAVLRYLERMEGVDVNSIRDKLLTPKLKEFVATVGGNGTFPIEGGKVIIRDNTIITVEN